MAAPVRAPAEAAGPVDAKNAPTRSLDRAQYARPTSFHKAIIYTVAEIENA
jgi:hypothetical protein